MKSLGLFFGQGNIEGFVFGSAIVFGAEEFFGDLSFFFFDDLLDIASDEFKVGQIWGQESRFGEDRLTDSRDVLAFVEEVSKFFLGRLAIDTVLEVFDCHRVGFDRRSSLETSKVLPVLARWIQKGCRRPHRVGAFFVALATVGKSQDGVLREFFFHQSVKVCQRHATAGDFFEGLLNLFAAEFAVDEFLQKQSHALIIKVDPHAAGFRSQDFSFKN